MAATGTEIEVDRRICAGRWSWPSAAGDMVEPESARRRRAVRDGEVIGEGHHAELGGLHAERAALADARERGNDPAGATLYVTLEPCAHEGRQPPCTEALLEAGVARVVYASEDPTEKASGRGPGMLRDGGVEVELATGAEAAAARLLNQPFRKLARTGRPLVTYKAAMTLDGRVAAPGGDSRWISAVESRELVHRWRVGVRRDRGRHRHGAGRRPAADRARRGRRSPRASSRPAWSSTRRPGCRSTRPWSDRPTRRRCSSSARPRPPALSRDALEAAGRRGRRRRGTRQRGAARRARSTSSAAASSPDLLVEGGPTLAGALFDAGEIDRMRLFIAPVLIGAGEARAVLEGEGARRIAEGLRPLAVEPRVDRRGPADRRPPEGVVSGVHRNSRRARDGRGGRQRRRRGAHPHKRGARRRARPRATRSRSTAPA